MKIKVILLENIKGVGKKDEIINVRMDMQIIIYSHKKKQY